MTDVIRFAAQVFKVQTLVDGGLRLTLDLPETEIPQMAMLMECKRGNIPLLISVVSAIQEHDYLGELVDE